MNSFRLQSSYAPKGDQPQAIEALIRGIEKGAKEQVLLGVTGSGKTFTIANVIEKINRPVLVISHNKTLAAQLYQELRDYFPTNAVSYFVSYYDYYQPEAYVPQTDTYIEKETQINEEIDKLRLSATANLLTRNDTIVVASVSCIYNIGSPKEYGSFILELRPGVKISRESIMKRLIQLQYERSNFGFHRGTFRVRGEAIDVFPAYEDTSLRIIMDDNIITHLQKLHPLTGKILEEYGVTVLYPAKHFMTDPSKHKSVFAQIRKDMQGQADLFKSAGKYIEAQRITQRVNYDLEMIEEMGYVNGIENYSRYFDERSPGDPPYSLLDYYAYSPGMNKDKSWLLIIDESHMTIPQIRGMYNGDRSRKQTLIDYGFRLPAALDNRPLTFVEFLRRMPQTVYVSATPDEWEVSRSNAAVHAVKSAKTGIVEQLIRPTGIIDPKISVRRQSGQIDDLLSEIQKRALAGSRVLVTTLTKQTAEDLSDYLTQKGVKVRYLHSDVQTLDRTDILADLRTGVFDAIIGVNLLREGLDLPEVTLVAILDADKQGFLRSKISLIQTMGRAARNIESEVILYADTMTPAMSAAIEEVTRRRKVQLHYNKTHGIVPRTIQKPVRKRLVERSEDTHISTSVMDDTDLQSMTPLDKQRLIRHLKKRMNEASSDLDFESAASLRDKIKSLTE